MALVAVPAEPQAVRTYSSSGCLGGGAASLWRSLPVLLSMPQQSWGTRTGVSALMPETDRRGLFHEVHAEWQLSQNPLSPGPFLR